MQEARGFHAAVEGKHRFMADHRLTPPSHCVGTGGRRESTRSRH